MAIGVSGMFDNDQNEQYDYEGGIGICGSDTRECLKKEQEDYDKDVSLLGVHSMDE